MGVVAYWRPKVGHYRPLWRDERADNSSAPRPLGPLSRLPTEVMAGGQVLNGFLP